MSLGSIPSVKVDGGVIVGATAPVVPPLVSFFTIAMPRIKREKRKRRKKESREDDCFDCVRSPFVCRGSAYTGEVLGDHARGRLLQGYSEFSDVTDSLKR